MSALSRGHRPSWVVVRFDSGACWGPSWESAPLHLPVHDRFGAAHALGCSQRNRKSYTDTVAREQQILAAAEKLFAERSFDGVGVDAIGREAGVTGAAVYHHFASKEQILSELFDRATDALLLSIGKPLDDPYAELVRLVNACVDFSLSHERLARVWAREQGALAAADRRNFLRRQRRYFERWIQALDRCYPGRSPHELVAAVHALHAMIMGNAPGRRGAKSYDRRALLVDLALAATAGLGDTLQRAAN